MQSRNNLSNFRPGESVVVKSIAQNELAPKLVEMGLYEGKKLRVLYKAPFGCPMAVDVDGYTLSLRMDEAEMVNVELIAA